MTQYSGKVIRKTPVTPTQQSASGVWKLNEQAAAIRNNSWPVPGVPDPISRSVRLRASASAYLNRTPANASNRKTWTYSIWFKYAGVGIQQMLGGAGGSGNETYLAFNSTGELQFRQVDSSTQTMLLQTNQVFRDPSAWYHIVVSVDTTQATASNRSKIYINGSQVTSFSTASYYSLNADTYINAAVVHELGRRPQQTLYFDGYLTEINLIDGQALTPSSFGTTDTATGAWIPMPYTGTYGTNGFYLNFKDNTSTTTIGYDYSGNSNNWTANNISLTAGSTYDSMLDVPTPWVGYSTTTDTSAVTRGNYATLNPLSSTYAVTFSEANLKGTFTGGNSSTAGSTIAVSSGKWYAEMTIGSTNSGTRTYPLFGICNPKTFANPDFLGDSADEYSYSCDGYKTNNGTATSVGTTLTANDVMMVAFDADNGKIWWGKNGTWIASGDPANGANAMYSSIPLSTYVFAICGYTSTNAFINFGQRPFAYTPPTGFKTLCTTNLPTPTITNGANYMAASTYTGTGSTRSVVNSGNNAAAISFQPDLVWVKSRNNSNPSQLTDSVRGNTLALASDLTIAEYTGEITINSTGYSASGGAGATNMSGWTYVAWQWKAGAGTTSSNTSGSITSTVSVNQTAGFSVVTYTGTLAAATIGHGLGAVPAMIITKNRAQAGYNWRVYHVSTGAANYMSLNLTNASAAASSVWNNTTPTSTVFSVANDGGSNNTDTMVAYCWAAVAGFSAFGSYTGNGSSDGPFVYCGFRPRWILFKRTDLANDWFIYDTARSTYNAMSVYLLPDSSAAEAGTAGSNDIDVTANGFKIRNSNNYDNASGGTIIYAAFAENPFKYSNAR